MIRKAEMKDYLDIARLSGVLGYPISEAAVKKNLAPRKKRRGAGPVPVLLRAKQIGVDSTREGAV